MNIIKGEPISAQALLDAYEGYHSLSPPTVYSTNIQI